MCGIIGYVGKKPALPIIIDGLKRLNYRGYDSAGISTLQDTFHVYKNKGDISILEKSVPTLPGTLGIGHTRWATHGGVTLENAHPHFSSDKKIAVVHNGIIENFNELRNQLLKEGCIFASETDSEIIAHLIRKYYKGNLEQATRKAIRQIKGSYAIAVMSQDEQEKLVAARNGSPLVIGIGDNEYYTASDIPALLNHTNKVIYLDDQEIATISYNQLSLSDSKGKTIQKEPQTILWTSQDVEKSGYAHYMLKEIHEQPTVLRQTTQKRISDTDGWVYFKELDKHEQFFADVKRIKIISCGTSFYAGAVGKYFFETLTKIPVFPNIATEYYPFYVYDKQTLIITISQSGETADTLNAMRQAKAHGAKILNIGNNPGSTASRVADWTILGNNGPEIGVAATKTFTAQLTLLFLLSIFLGRRKHVMNATPAIQYLKQLRMLPQIMQNLLGDTSHIQSIAKTLQHTKSMFYIGRNIHHPLALEGALKMKEIAYIHAEGFSAGELKHGPFALLTSETPVVALCPIDETYEKMLSSIIEIKARGAPVIAITTQNNNDIMQYVDEAIIMPNTLPIFTPFLSIITCQLLAYYTASIRGCNIDKPRNLAKSVTVI